jgi:uncharacterized protein (DUF1810 family)
MPVMDDPFQLARFTTAQDQNGTYARAVAELRAGEKRSHWMWFIFPQVAGLGLSEMSRRYAISGLAEARAYLAHPVLGPRLAECAAVLTALPGTTATRVFGSVDALKLHSSMTLFAAAAADAPAGTPAQPAFAEVLDRYFDAQPDEATLAHLAAAEA